MICLWGMLILAYKQFTTSVVQTCAIFDRHVTFATYSEYSFFFLRFFIDDFMVNFVSCPVIYIQIYMHIDGHNRLCIQHKKKNKTLVERLYFEAMHSIVSGWPRRLS